MLTYRIPIAHSPGDSAGADPDSRPGRSHEEEDPEEFLDADADADWEDAEEDWDEEEDEAEWEEEAPLSASLAVDDDWDEEDVELPARFRQVFRTREELPRRRKDREE